METICHSYITISFAHNDDEDTTIFTKLDKRFEKGELSERLNLGITLEGKHQNPIGNW
jgi:hypothetical protein